MEGNIKLRNLPSTKINFVTFETQVLSFIKKQTKRTNYL
jgi:hypothetical protein